MVVDQNISWSLNIWNGKSNNICLSPSLFYYYYYFFFSSFFYLGFDSLVHLLCKYDSFTLSKHNLKQPWFIYRNWISSVQKEKMHHHNPMREARFSTQESDEALNLIHRRLIFHLKGWPLICLLITLPTFLGLDLG